MKKKNKNRLSTTAHTGLTGVTGFFTASSGNVNNRSRMSKASEPNSIRSLGRMDNSSGGDGVVNRQSNPEKYGTVQNRSIRSVNSNNNLMNQSSALNS